MKKKQFFLQSLIKSWNARSLSASDVKLTAQLSLNTVLMAVALWRMLHNLFNQPAAPCRTVCQIHRFNLRQPRNVMKQEKKKIKAEKIRVQLHVSPDAPAPVLSSPGHKQTLSLSTAFVPDFFSHAFPRCPDTSGGNSWADPSCPPPHTPPSMDVNKRGQCEGGGVSGRDRWVRRMDRIMMRDRNVGDEGAWGV